MKRLVWLFVMVLLVTPAFAQDDSGGGDGGGIGDGGGLFGGGGGGAGGGNRGGQAATVDRLVTLRDMLAKANAPLTKDQEKALNSLLDKEIKTMSESLRAKFPQETEAAAAAGQRGGQRQGQQGQGQGRGQGSDTGQAPRGQGVGGRGGRGGRGVAVDTPYTAEIRRMNDELLGKVTASLKPEQQVVIKKWENDQIRARGGLDALKLTMDEAGAPLTAEQIPQIQALYAELNQSRAQLLRESQGQPDPAKLSQLDLGTMSKVAKLLNDNQRKALLESMAKSRQ